MNLRIFAFLSIAFMPNLQAQQGIRQTNETPKYIARQKDFYEKELLQGLN